MKINVDLPGFFRFFFFVKNLSADFAISSIPHTIKHFLFAVQLHRRIFYFFHSLSGSNFCLCQRYRTESTHWMCLLRLSRPNQQDIFVKIYRNRRQNNDSLNFVFNFVLQMCWEYPLSCFRRCRLSHFCWYNRRTQQTADETKLANRNLLMVTTRTAQRNDEKKTCLLTRYFECKCISQARTRRTAILSKITQTPTDWGLATDSCTGRAGHLLFVLRFQFCYVLTLRSQFKTNFFFSLSVSATHAWTG